MLHVSTTNNLCGSSKDQFSRLWALLLFLLSGILFPTSVSCQLLLIPQELAEMALLGLVGHFFLLFFSLDQSGLQRAARP